MRELVVLALLGWNAWVDIRKREISLKITLAAGIAGFLFYLAGNGLSRGLAVRLLPGAVAVALSFATAGKAGLGDGILLLCLAALTRTEEMARTVFLGIFLGALWGLFLLIVRRKGRNHELPFVPFLFLGYVGGILL